MIIYYSFFLLLFFFLKCSVSVSLQLFYFTSTNKSNWQNDFDQSSLSGIIMQLHSF